MRSIDLEFKEKGPYPGAAGAAFDARAIADLSRCGAFFPALKAAVSRANPSGDPAVLRLRENRDHERSYGHHT